MSTNYFVSVFHSCTIAVEMFYVFHRNKEIENNLNNTTHFPAESSLIVT